MLLAFLSAMPLQAVRKDFGVLFLSQSLATTRSSLSSSSSSAGCRCRLFLLLLLNPFRCPLQGFSRDVLVLVVFLLLQGVVVLLLQGVVVALVVVRWRNCSN